MCGPFNTRSGYGDHARSIFYALHDSGKYNIKLWDVNWGNTPRNFLKQENKMHKLLINRMLSEPTMDTQPDIYIDIRIPNEFETFGKFNIGITAGVETTAVSQKWLEGCNKMDLIIVPSNHSKSSFTNSFYEKMQNMPDGNDKKIGELKLEKPMEVVFEGVDTNIYKKLDVKQLDRKILNLINETINEKFAFLFVGQWGNGEYGEDRKDIGKLVKIFYETFANLKDRPALILKTSGADLSLLDERECLHKIKSIKANFPSDWNLPNVYLLHGDFTDEEMNEMYNHPKIKCFVSFTHGEGFGRPMLESTIVGLPVICSGWSGQLDFLDDDASMLLNGKLEKIPKSIVWKDILIEESSWFVVDENDAYAKLTYAFKNPYDIKEKAKLQQRRNLEKYTMAKMLEEINLVIDRYTENIPTQTKISLPKLRKVEDNKSPKIKLPKLKKA